MHAPAERRVEDAETEGLLPSLEYATIDRNPRPSSDSNLLDPLEADSRADFKRSFLRRLAGSVIQLITATLLFLLPSFIAQFWSPASRALLSTKGARYTSYLDGVRGVAAWSVVNVHLTLAISRTSGAAWGHADGRGGELFLQLIPQSTSLANRSRPGRSFSISNKIDQVQCMTSGVYLASAWSTPATSLWQSSSWSAASRSRYRPS